MIFTHEMLMEIIEGDINVVYPVLRLLRIALREDGINIESEFDKVKNGVYLNYDIDYLIRGRMVKKEKQDLICVAHQWYRLEVFWKDLDARLDIARSTILKYATEAEAIKART